MVSPTTPSRTPAPSIIGEIRSTVTEARDDQVIQIVAMVDALPRRGTMDSLIAPLRPRLARLRPARPLRFGRLLFNPIDPLIAPAANWKPQSPTFPRTALTPLLTAVRSGMGPAADAIEAAMAQGNSADPKAVTEAGAQIWPAAADVLSAASRPANWPDTGLPDDLYDHLRLALAGILKQATRLRAIGQASGKTDKSAIRHILEQAAAESQTVWTMMLVLLMNIVADTDLILTIANKVAATGSSRAATEKAMDALLEQIETQSLDSGSLSQIDLAEAAAETLRMAHMLDSVHRLTIGQQRKKRVEEVRRRLDEGCRARFDSGLADQLLAPMTGRLVDADIIRLEDVARDLRRLEGVGRRVGSGRVYDEALLKAAGTVRLLPENGGLEHIDKVRMVEILAGPEEALNLLNSKKN